MCQRKDCAQDATRAVFHCKPQPNQRACSTITTFSTCDDLILVRDGQERFEVRYTCPTCRQEEMYSGADA